MGSSHRFFILNLFHSFFMIFWRFSAISALVAKGTDRIATPLIKLKIVKQSHSICTISIIGLYLTCEPQGCAL